MIKYVTHEKFYKDVCYDSLRLAVSKDPRCRRTDQHLDVMDQCIQIVRCNQEIIHTQRDESLQFSDVPIFPPVPDPYGSLTPAELAAFGIDPTRVSLDDDDDAHDDDDEETEDDE
jgi:hypothetical protein